MKNKPTVQPKGGYRDDLGIYVRSKMEANFARYLKWMKDQGDIKVWAYEVNEFVFPVKRGMVSYKPDFLIIENDGSMMYYEVKGYMDQRSITALKRMKKYYPHIKIIVIDKYFMKRLEDVKNLIPNWEE